MSIFTKLKDLTKALYGNIWQCARTEAAALKAVGRAAVQLESASVLLGQL